ncbi:hypothetical protein BDD12DRAFT_859615 [Trichophaea hybrida]|nr:hypothetical protein BDD12DRAFT_859615 [Trichophaea hybrida]
MYLRHLCTAFTCGSLCHCCLTEIFTLLLINPNLTFSAVKDFTIYRRHDYEIGYRFHKLFGPRKQKINFRSFHHDVSPSIKPPLPNICQLQLPAPIRQLHQHKHQNAITMSAVGSSASQAGSSLLKGARRDPELYVLGAIMTAAFSLVGFYFGRHPTSKTRLGEENINIAENTSPWSVKDGEIENSDRNNYKYIALNAVIVPNVDLPKSLHDRFNKWGKDNY